MNYRELILSQAYMLLGFNSFGGTGFSRRRSPLMHTLVRRNTPYIISQTAEGYVVRNREYAPVGVTPPTPEDPRRDFEDQDIPPLSDLRVEALTPIDYGWSFYVGPYPENPPAVRAHLIRVLYVFGDDPRDLPSYIVTADDLYDALPFGVFKRLKYTKNGSINGAKPAGGPKT